MATTLSVYRGDSHRGSGRSLVVPNPSPKSGMPAGLILSEQAMALLPNRLPKYEEADYAAQQVIKKINKMSGDEIQEEISRHSLPRSKTTLVHDSKPYGYLSKGRLFLSVSANTPTAAFYAIQREQEAGIVYHGVVNLLAPSIQVQIPQVQYRAIPGSGQYLENAVAMPKDQAGKLLPAMPTAELLVGGGLYLYQTYSITRALHLAPHRIVSAGAFHDYFSQALAPERLADTYCLNTENPYYHDRQYDLTGPRDFEPCDPLSEADGWHGI